MCFIFHARGVVGISQEKNQTATTKHDIITLFTRNAGLKPGGTGVYADRGHGSPWAAGRAAEQERSPSLEMLQSQRLIKANKMKYIPAEIGEMILSGFRHNFAKATLCPRPPPRSSRAAASNADLLGGNEVANPGLKPWWEEAVGAWGCQGHVSRCLCAGRRQAAANSLLVPAININKAIRNPTEHWAGTPKCSFRFWSARGTLSSAHLNSAPCSGNEAL